jgi:hypothetical protein
VAIAEKLIIPEAGLGRLASLLLLYCPDHHHLHKINLLNIYVCYFALIYRVYAHHPPPKPAVSFPAGFFALTACAGLGLIGFVLALFLQRPKR